MELTANARTVLERRYLARDSRGDVAESPEAMVLRIARAVAEAERAYGGAKAADEWTERFAARIGRLEFVPNSPTLMNAGRPLGQLSACFVVPVEDSTEAIFEAVGLAATIQKTGGGTGFAFSRLRPAGDLVESTGGRASGPVAFMLVFDTATEAIKQGGTRRGANMGVLHVDHPDILDFIAVKLDGQRMRNFNLSVAVTDEFMAAVSAGAEHSLRNPRTGAVVRRLPARRIFEAMVNAAWASGDPGLVFIDRINDTQPTPALGHIEATNPCGEQPLLPFESCNLGSLNLASFVRDGALDKDELRRAVADAVRFLDDVIDVNRYPLPQIGVATRATRKIGLGVMGLADLLIALGVPYDEPPALAIAEEIAELLERESIRASQELAAERGAFPAHAASRWVSEGWAGDGRPLRNATTTTVAPTGTISIIAGCSSGIEPLYAVAYHRNVLDGDVLLEVHPQFRRMLEERGLWSDALAAELAERGAVRGWDAIPEDLQRLFPTSHEIDVAQHIAMQAAFQRHVHAAVSKTVNLPSRATPEDVAQAFVLAHELGCKGVTIYRDGSKGQQVLATGAVVPPSAAVTTGCPECGGAITHGSACDVCPSCGWSVCG